jgi:hypothetical protein
MEGERGRGELSVSLEIPNGDDSHKQEAPTERNQLRSLSREASDGA